MVMHSEKTSLYLTQSFLRSVREDLRLVRNPDRELGCTFFLMVEATSADMEQVAKCVSAATYDINDRNIECNINLHTFHCYFNISLPRSLTVIVS